MGMNEVNHIQDVTHPTTETRGHPRRSVWNRASVAVFAAAAGAITSFALLLSTLPLIVTALGGGTAAAGTASGAFMLGAVAGELTAPASTRWISSRRTINIGICLLAIPALALLAGPSLPAIVGLSAVRGVGFGLVVVVGNASAAALAPEGRMGSMMGAYGLVTGVPLLVSVPLGVALWHAFGSGPVLWAAAIAPMPALALSKRFVESGADKPTPLAGVVSFPDRRRPLIVFGVVACSAGAIATFLPIAEPGPVVSVFGLAAYGAVGTLTRWLAGRSDLPPTRIVRPMLLAAALGVGLLALPSVGFRLTGLLIFGAAFGAVENTMITLVYQRSDPEDYPAVSAAWNAAYDSSLAVGSITFGIAASGWGFEASFLLAAALIGLMIRRGVNVEISNR